jgi:hypothetical protein
MSHRAVRIARAARRILAILLARTSHASPTLRFFQIARVASLSMKRFTPGSVHWEAWADVLQASHERAA